MHDVSGETERSTGVFEDANTRGIRGGPLREVTHDRDLHALRSLISGLQVAAPYPERP